MNEFTSNLAICANPHPVYPVPSSYFLSANSCWISFPRKVFKTRTQLKINKSKYNLIELTNSLQCNMLFCIPEVDMRANTIPAILHSLHSPLRMHSISIWTQIGRWAPKIFWIPFGQKALHNLEFSSKFDCVLLKICVNIYIFFWIWTSNLHSIGNQWFQLVIFLLGFTQFFRLLLGQHSIHVLILNKSLTVAK